MNIKKTLFLTIGLFIVFTLFGQDKNVAIIGFYNVENLYDTEQDTTIFDTDFLPNGPYQWTMERYLEKLKNLAEVISAMEKSKGCPVVLGVAEVENEKVLLDLVSQEKLLPYKYKVAHHDSPDLRGVDVAFIYQSDRFQMLSLQDFELIVPENPQFRTRDQLLMTGVLDQTDTLYLIANHWPSKRGGEARSMPLRMAAAKLTRSIVDTILAVNPQAKVIIMGDFNDNPTAKSFTVGLGAKGKIADVGINDIFNPMWKMYKDGIGSYAYRDSWEMIDQIMVTYHLLHSKPNSYKFVSAHVFQAGFMITKAGSFTGYPLRTYAGGSYQGGYSDHFPVYIILQRNKVNE